jgi:hypothetical protein
MGKLKLSDASDLVKKGVLTEDSLKEMQTSGLVSSRSRSPKRYMLTANKKNVSPTLYFRGGSGQTDSKKMIELREEVNEIIRKYTKPIKNGG